MKCYSHHDRDAVGTCKSCQRGLCPDCAVDLTKGLACRARCEDDVQGLIRLIENNLRLSPTTSSLIQASRRGDIIGAGFPLVLGAIFAGWGFHDNLSFIVALGAVFLFFGLISLIRILRITAPKAQP